MDRFEATKKVGIFGILGNVFLLVIKASIGFASNSQSMIADSLNSASDIFASLMTFIGNKIASEPQDKDHNLGHGKAEYIFSMLISISMIGISLKLFIDSIVSLIHKNTLTFSWYLIIICIVSIIIKLALYLYTKKANLNHNNLLIKSNMKDHRNDCVITLFTLISILLTLKNIYWFDGIVGIGISLWISYTGICIFIESFNVLMDISIDDKTKDLISKLIFSYDDIHSIINIISTPVGNKYLVFLTVSVDGNLSTFESHKLADVLENDVNKLDGIYKTVVHIEPY